MPRKLPRNLVRRGGTFYYRVKVAGKSRRVSLETSDEDVARAKVRSLNRDGLPSPMTVSEAAKKWLAGYVLTARRNQDHALASQRVRDYLNEHLGAMRLSKLTKEHLREYRLALEKTTLSVQTVRHLLSDLRCMLNWCEDEGYLERAPIPRRWLPRVQERPPDRLSEEEIAQVITLPDPYGFVCRFLVRTGLRWSEFCRAQSTDIQAGVLVVSQTKSGKVRRIPLAPDLLTEVRGRIGKLCPFSSHGQFNRMVRKLSGLSGFHVHQLRHSFGCLWLERGGSLAALQELLGHSTIVTTQRYARLGEAHVAEEARRVFGKGVAEGVTAAKAGNA